MTFEEVEQLYPCPDRRGVGHAGCSCNSTYRPDNRLVSCRAYGSTNYPADNCVNCPFRFQHEARIKQLNG
jgi:hypothetical protein